MTFLQSRVRSLALGAGTMSTISSQNSHAECHGVSLPLTSSHGRENALLGFLPVKMLHFDILGSIELSRRDFMFFSHSAYVPRHAYSDSDEELSRGEKMKRKGPYLPGASLSAHQIVRLAKWLNERNISSGF